MSTVRADNVEPARAGTLGIGSPGVPSDLFAESTVRENLLALQRRLDRLHNERVERVRWERSWAPGFASAFVERDRAWMPSVLCAEAP
jgi:hypothetical protein